MSLDAEHLMEQFRITEKVNPAFQFPAVLDPHKDALVIIDMQPFFVGARNPETLRACQDLIRRFMATHCHIIIVEYAREKEYEGIDEELGTTHPELTALLEDYNKIIRVQKSNDDGSKNLFEAIKIFLCKDPLQMHLTVCGVNIMACVVRTVRGLLAQGFEDLIMAKQACNDNCWSGEWDDFYTEVKNFSCCDYTHTKVDVLNGPEYDLLNAVA